MSFDSLQRNQVAATLQEVLRRPFLTICDRLFHARTAHGLLTGPAHRKNARRIIERHAEAVRSGFTWMDALPAAESHLMRGRQHQPFRWLVQTYPCALRAADDWADRVNHAID